LWKSLGNEPLIRPDLPDPGTFALLGAGAFLSGSGAIVLFAIAMLIEVTGEADLIFPVALVCFVSRGIGRACKDPGLYHSLIHLQPWPFLPSKADRRITSATVGALLPAQAVVTLTLSPATEEVAAALDTPHHGFPVVDADGKLVGLISRDQLLTYSERPQDRLATSSPILGRVNQGGGLRPYVDLAPWQVPENFPAFRAYMLFTQIGVRHIVVTKKGQVKPVGVLTRKDLLPYDQLRRMNTAQADIDRHSSLENFVEEGELDRAFAGGPTDRNRPQRASFPLLQSESER
jgi:CBS domain-containing protein